MCDRYEYEHLMLEETMTAQALDDPMPTQPSDSGDNRYEDAYEAHQESVTAFVSPFVRRNLDCAQYPQPRGSQYEG